MCPFTKVEEPTSERHNERVQHVNHQDYCVSWMGCKADYSLGLKVLGRQKLQHCKSFVTYNATVIQFEIFFDVCR